MNGTTITIGPAALRDLIADQVILNQPNAASGSLFHATRIARGVVEALGERQHLPSRPDERPVSVATTDIHDHIIRQVTRYEPHVLMRTSRFQAENIARNVLAALRARTDASTVSNATSNTEPLEIALEAAIGKFAPSLADDVRREIASEAVRKAISSVTAELRHAYTHLAAGRVVDQKSLADGLLAPQIRRLEKLYSESPGTCSRTTVRVMTSRKDLEARLDEKRQHLAEIERDIEDTARHNEEVTSLGLYDGIRSDAGSQMAAGMIQSEINQLEAELASAPIEGSDEDDAERAWMAFSDGFDHESSEWLDMGADETFKAGYAAGRASRQGRN